MMRFAYSPYSFTPTPADRRALKLSARDTTCILTYPDLKVRVCGAGKHSREESFWGLVDTGAAECVLPAEIAEWVRPAWCGEGAITDYSGADHAVRYGLVHLQIRLEKERHRWPAVVAFCSDRKQAALWGRRCFLEYFRVTFDGPGNHFTIRLRGQLPPGSRSERVPILRPTRRGAKGSSLITRDKQDP